MICLINKSQLVGSPLLEHMWKNHCKDLHDRIHLHVSQRPESNFSVEKVLIMDVPTPSVVAMLICDQIIVEQGSGKKRLIGIFENLNTFAFPTQARMALYVKLMDVDGRYDFLVRIVNLKNETKLAEINAPNIELTRESMAELVINIAGIVFQEAGKYEFQLHANGIYLHRAVMNAVRIQGGSPWQPQQSPRRRQ